MPRNYKSTAPLIKPDPKYGSMLAAKIINKIMWSGKKSTAQAIFYDAKRSHHEWFSCHTCHPDGHTSGRAFDTLNDDSGSNPKMSPTLRNVTRTGPWTWHGWQKELGHAVEKSLTETLFGPKPAAGDVKAVLAYLETLAHPPALPSDADAKAAARLWDVSERLVAR